MLIVSFDCHVIVHYEFEPESQTVSAVLHVEVQKCLNDRVCRARPNLSKDGCWILHHDYSPPANSELIMREFLARTFGTSITLLAHPPQSKDLAPWDIFFLFRKYKLVLRGWHIVDVTTIKKETTSLLKRLTEENFRWCFQRWKRWNHCTVCNGEYFEGDQIDVFESSWN